MSKNTSSKGKPKPGSKPTGARSRNTTPLPNVRTSVEPPAASASYFSKPLTALGRKCDVTVEEILDRAPSNNQQVPSGTALISMRESIETKVLANVQKRSDVSNSALRELQSLKKNNRSSHDRDKERTPKKDPEDHKHKLKKQGKRAPEDERPLAVGAHAVARQDGEPTKDNSSTISSPISQAPPSATGTGPADPPSPTNSDASHQPAPAVKIVQMQTFGPDPSKFDDPTIYHIRDVNPGMPDDLVKEIYCVAGYPSTDLNHKRPGTPPSKDFSSAKPTNQVSASVFANYVEPYIRPLTEEDVAFLKERGDRMGPFVLPRRGNRSYKDIWAEEDGQMHIDTNERHLPNESRGSYDDMRDDILEKEEISTGPLLARLLSTLRPEGRGTSSNPNDANGTNGDAMDIDEGPGAPADATNNNSIPAATQLSEFALPGWKAPPTNGRTDYATLEERMLMELKHYGMISDTDTETAAYDSHFDDEVAARLRFLQNELRKQSIVNGARKQRLLELTEERIAQQEYNTIADDLDNQLNSAYLKRNRNIGKGKKQAKRPGGAGGGSHAAANAGISRPGVGEPIRTLMERKTQWNNTIGPVVNYGKTGLPGESIFEEEQMKKLESREVEIWNNEADE